MQFLAHNKRSIVVDGERVWEDDERYADLTRRAAAAASPNGGSTSTAADDATVAADDAAAAEQEWHEARAKIWACFTPTLLLKVAAWVALFYSVGPHWKQALVLATPFVLIFLNLGKKKDGELSAYNVFNPNFRRIGGDNLAEQFEAQLRHVPVQQLQQGRQQRATVRGAGVGSGGGDGGGDSDSDADVGQLRPRDKVIVAHRQGGQLRYKTMKWKHAEVFVRTEGWTVVEVLRFVR